MLLNKLLLYNSGHSCRQIFIELKGFTEYVVPTTAFRSTTAATYGVCLAACRSDHKCLSLKYTDGDDNCLLYDTVPHHKPEEPKKPSDRDFRTAVLQCGTNPLFCQMLQIPKILTLPYSEIYFTQFL